MIISYRQSWMEENLLYGMITHIDRPGSKTSTDNTVYFNHKNFGLRYRNIVFANRQSY